MRIQVYLQMVILFSVYFLLNGAVGNAESEIPLIIQYDLQSVRETESRSVTFKHQAHMNEYRISCVRCHHTLEPGATAVEETCSDCHVDTDVRKYLPMRAYMRPEERQEYYILALHDQCINCHKEIKKHNRFSNPPAACWGCHIRQKK